MFGIGSGELLLLLIIALIVLGPERMPKLARDLGRVLADFRRTSDELREEFLNADKYLEARSALPAPPAAIAPPATPTDVGVAEPPSADAAPPDAGATEAAVATDPPEADETAFDRDARLARKRLEDPEYAKRAAAEGWKIPTDEAGTSDRWG